VTTPWRGFRIIPDDLLFFRDGRPSTRGDDHYLRSLFPPNPSTLYGALRTRRLLDAGVSLRELRKSGRELWEELPDELRSELGAWGGFGTLEIRGPWLVSDKDGVLLPAPADLAVVVPREEDTTSITGARSHHEEPPLPFAGTVVVRFLAAEDPGGRHSHQGRLLHPFTWEGGGWAAWTDPAPPRVVPGWWLTPQGLAAWAEGSAPAPADLVHSSALWLDEARVGVGLQADQRTSADGQLYTFGFIRLRPGISLGFDARGTGLEPGRRVVLGGEGRTGWLAEGPILPASPVPSTPASGLRVALATPALSASGAALPGFAAVGTAGELLGTTTRLSGALVSGHTLVGGWDLARSRPKPLRRAIPVGSVGLLQAEPTTSLEPAAFHGRAVSDFEDEEHLARQGFGLLLAGIEPQIQHT
jgi:CRISPR-associated protein Cmr3